MRVLKSDLKKANSNKGDGKDDFPTPFLFELALVPLIGFPQLDSPQLFILISTKLVN